MKRFLSSFLILSFGLACSSAKCRQITTPLDKENSETPASSGGASPLGTHTDGETIKVFKPDGSKQCGGGSHGISPDEMEKQFKKIKVLSKVSSNDGKMRIQMCGAPTGNVNVFEINKKDLKKAEKLGFKVMENP